MGREREGKKKNKGSKRFLGSEEVRFTNEKNLHRFSVYLLPNTRCYTYNLLLGMDNSVRSIPCRACTSVCIVLQVFFKGGGRTILMKDRRCTHLKQQPTLTVLVWDLFP